MTIRPPLNLCGLLRAPVSPVSITAVPRSHAPVQPHHHPEEAAWMDRFDPVPSRTPAMHENTQSRRSSLWTRVATACMATSLFLGSSSCIRVFDEDVSSYNSNDFLVDAALMIGGSFFVGIASVLAIWHISDWRAGRTGLVPRQIKSAISYVRSLRFRSAQEFQSRKEEPQTEDTKDQEAYGEYSRHSEARAHERERLHAEARERLKAALQKRLQRVNHFEVLGLEPSADIDGDVLKRAKREAVMLYHEDRVSHLGPKLQQVAKDETLKILNAYDVLSNPRQRAAHLRDLGYNE